MIKDTMKSELVWFRARELHELMKFLDKEININLSPNMMIRYLCVQAMQDKLLRQRCAERINNFFQEKIDAANKWKKGFRCCEKCDHSESLNDAIRIHRLECKAYQDLTNERIKEFMDKEGIKLVNSV